MSGIQACATYQGRFFTSRNPEQAPNFEVFSPEQALIFKDLQQNTIFSSIFSQSGLGGQKRQLLS